MGKKTDPIPAKSRTVDNTSLIIIALPAITAELETYTKYSDLKFFLEG